MSELTVLLLIVVLAVAALVGFLAGYFLGWHLRGRFERGEIGPQELRKLMEGLHD